MEKTIGVRQHYIDGREFHREGKELLQIEVINIICNLIIVWGIVRFKLLMNHYSLI